MSKSTLFALMMGMAVGAAASWIGLKKYYEKIAQEEISSVKSVYAKKHDEEIKKAINSVFGTGAKKEERHDRGEEIGEGGHLYSEPDMYCEDNSDTEVVRKINEAYSGGHTCVDNGDEYDFSSKPYSIPPEKFGDMYEYEQVSLNYYADGVLADDIDDIIDNVDDTVGRNFATYFGEYEDDSVFIRNDRLRCDFEILRDNRTYAEVVGREP